MIYNLNLLRALAALAVAFLHITWEAGLGLPFKVGGYGVDVFFVISGFIMSYQRSESAGDFAKRRIIRIVPFYWCATFVVFGAALLFPNLLRSTRADFLQLLCSLFFIPRETDYAGMYPTLVLGWSLNYEMYFYAVFALCLSLVPRYAPGACAVLIGLIAAAISIAGIEHPSIQFYSREIILEFALGIGCYYACREAEKRAPSLRAVVWAPPVLVVLAIGACVMLGASENSHGWGHSRLLVAGLPAAVLVLCALLLERVWNKSIRGRVLYLMGESSYVLYLIHPYIIFAVLRLLIRDPGSLSTPATVALIVSLLILTALVAVVIHLVLEKPMIRALRERWLHRTVNVENERRVTREPVGSDAAR